MLLVIFGNIMLLEGFRDMGYTGIMNKPVVRGPITIEKNGLFKTFKTTAEMVKYFEMFSAEEKRLLYMGAGFMNNLIAHYLETQSKK